MSRDPETLVPVPAPRGRAVRLAPVLLCLALAPVQARAQLTPTTEKEKKICRQVAALLDAIHIRGERLDDTMSHRFFDSYLETLDPVKLYFLKSDVDEFNSYRSHLDDRLRSGDLDFALLVFRRLLERVDERLAEIEELIAMDHDFTADEYIATDRDRSGFPRARGDMRELWRKRIKLLLLEKLAAGETLEAARKQLLKRYRDFADRLRKTDNEELLQLYLNAATTTFDPHTSYMSPATLENFEISMRLELEGIGAALQSIDGYTVVSEIIAGGAADRDGRLQPQDKITAVAEGKDGEFVDVVEMKLQDVVKLIRGTKGTTVRLQVMHAEGNERQTLTLERAKVELKHSEALGEVLEHGVRPDGQPFRVGVIDLPTFYRDMSGASRGLKGFKSSTRDVARLLERFEEQKVDAVVVDLRRNGGGSLPEAIEMTGLFIDKGPVVQIKGPRGFEQKSDPLPGMAWHGPLVVLVSKLSASASEIFAGAIQDYRRGLVVGDRSTHGKGTVQQLLDLGDERLGGDSGRRGALKITVSQFYRPTGNSTQNLGVIPDIELPSVRNHMEIGEAYLDYAIEFGQVPPIAFERTDLVSDERIDAVRRRSEARREAPDALRDQREAIARYLRFDGRKFVPLKRARFMAEYEKRRPRREAELDTPLEKADEEAGDTGERQDTDAAGDETGKDGKDETRKILRDAYLDEVLSITRDLVEVAA